MELLKKQELSIIKVDNLKALKEIEPEVQKLLSENVFIQPTTESINEAETRRKNLKKGRTTLENLRTEVTGPILKAKQIVDDFANDFKAQISEAETKQEMANNKFFDLKAWEKAKETNTIENYQEYLATSKIKAFRNDAELALDILKKQELEQVEKFETWQKEQNNKIALAGSLDELNKIDSELEETDLNEFYNYDVAFESRETMFVLIDRKKAQLIEQEKAAKEAEQRREQAEKLAKEAEERRKKAEEKARIEAEQRKIEQQKTNFENAVFVLDSIKMALPGINEISMINPYYTKLESVIEKDFGNKEDDIKAVYVQIKKLLDSKNGELVQVERERLKEIEAKQKAEKEAEEKARAESEKEKAEIERKKQADYESKLSDASGFSQEFCIDISKHLNKIQEHYPKKDFNILLNDIENLVFNFLKP